MAQQIDSERLTNDLIEALEGHERLCDWLVGQAGSHSDDREKLQKSGERAANLVTRIKASHDLIPIALKGVGEIL